MEKQLSVMTNKVFVKINLAGDFFERLLFAIDKN